MESLSKQELISNITKQSDQIKRYEARLRDVVAAYKGLVKEKEALEISLKALNRTDNGVAQGVNSTDDSVTALTLSLSTLAEEKARMEDAFQADKKVTREKYENIIASMREETKSLVQQHLVEVNNLKAKIAYEIQEREKERADHTAMLKEFNIKLNSERICKEKLEDKVVSSNDSQASVWELEKRVRDLSDSLEAAQRRLHRAEGRTTETPALLARLHHKLALLEQAHSIALREEQIKAKRAEETARKQCARQEERVASLEGKLAELSFTVGEYELRRRKDSETIHQLQNSLNTKILNSADSKEETSKQVIKSETDNDKLADSEYLQTLIDKIHILKKELIAENEKLGNPIDIPAVFKLEGYENIHIKCKEEIERITNEFKMFKALNLNTTKDDVTDSQIEIEDLKSEIGVLNEKVDTYRMMLDEEKRDKAEAIKHLEEQIRNEKSHSEEIISDLKLRIQSLEKQVQIQRDRYAALLDETDHYMRTRNDGRKDSVDEGKWKDTALPDNVGVHVLHYSSELARRDLEVTTLRRDKHILDGMLRDSQREATIEKERFKEVVRTLKEEIDRLRRTQSREGANLEYLKNVVLAYLVRRKTSSGEHAHMLNAIAAVLHFTDDERKQVIKAPS